MFKKVYRKTIGQVIDPSFIKSPRNYIVQSLIAVVAVTCVLGFVEILTNAAIVAGIAASTFIVFAMPNSITARPRRLIGGHVVGLICGIICYHLFIVGPLERIFSHYQYLLLLVCALTVGLSIFMMTATNTEHPPAASTALGIVLEGWSYKLILFILLYMIILAVVKWLLRSYLKNLF